VSPALSRDAKHLVAQGMPCLRYGRDLTASAAGT